MGWGSRGSAVGIATGYGLDGKRGRSSSPEKGKNSLFFLYPRLFLGSIQSLHECGGSFPGVKRSGRGTNRSPPTSGDVKNTWIYTSTPPYAQLAEHRDIFSSKLLEYSTTKRAVFYCLVANKQTPWPLVRKRTIPTQRPPLVGEI
jgi:hypothetical protein